MNKKILELYPLTFSADAAKKLSRAIAPSGLDQVFYAIFTAAMNGNHTVEFVFDDVDISIIEILRALGYIVVGNNRGYKIIW